MFIDGQTVLECKWTTVCHSFIWEDKQSVNYYFPIRVQKFFFDSQYLIPSMKLIFSKAMIDVDEIYRIPIVKQTENVGFVFS